MKQIVKKTLLTSTPHPSGPSQNTRNIYINLFIFCLTHGATHLPLFSRPGSRPHFRAQPWAHLSTDLLALLPDAVGVDELGLRQSLRFDRGHLQVALRAGGVPRMRGRVMERPRGHWVMVQGTKGVDPETVCQVPFSHVCKRLTKAPHDNHEIPEL